MTLDWRVRVAFLAWVALLALMLVSVLTKDAAHAASSMRVGFNVGGGHESIAADLAQLNGSTFANFCCPLDTSQDLPGVVTIRILRHKNGCPTSFGYGCTIPTSQLAAFAAANPGQTYELGNEPGNVGQDGLKGFVTWERLGYQTIKGADPTAVVIGPGILNWPSYYSNHPTLLFDAVAYHLYPSNLCLSASWLAAVKSTTDKAVAYAQGRGVPIWMSEMSDDPSCSGSPANRTNNVAALRSYLVSKGVTGAIWFTEGDIGFGTGYLFNLDNTLTPEGLGWRN